jgi:Leucine-rich repeat (LRR) protein
MQSSAVPPPATTGDLRARMEQLLNSLCMRTRSDVAEETAALAQEMQALLALVHYPAPRLPLPAAMVQSNHTVGLQHLTLSALPLDLLGCMCAFLYVHEHVQLMSTCPLLLRQCSLPRTWHTVVFAPERSVPVGLRLSSAGSLDRVMAGASSTSSCRWKWSEVRQLGWPPRRQMADEDKEAWVALDGLKDLVSLRHLTLAGVKIQGDLTPLSACRMLRVLDVSDTSVVDISPLSTLTTLQKLKLGNTQVADISSLSMLTTLQVLWLHGTQVVDIFSLSTLTGLQELALNGTQVAEISSLSTLTGLQQLHLDYTQVANTSSLSTLTALQKLNLVNTQVADISTLSALTALQKLYLGRTQVADISSLSTLTALQVLGLYRTQVADISCLSTLTALQKLWLNGTQVADISSLSMLTALQVLF